MIMLLHGAIANGRFLLWGETRPRDGIPAPRRTRPRRPPLLPFDAGPELLNAMAEMSFAPRTIQPITVLVPSVAGRPLPSSPLISEPPDVVADTTLTAWSVSALDLSASQAVDLLCACVGKRLLARGLIIADDLAFWATALRFAGAVVARQAYLPDLIETDGGYMARWRPVLGARESDALTRLAAAMPPACRAASLDSAAMPPSISATAALTGFLEDMVDALARDHSSAEVEPHVRPRGSTSRARSSSKIAIDQRWLEALRAADARVAGSPGELSELATRVQDWRRPIATAFASPFRLCFRLEEPVRLDPDDEIEVDCGNGVWFIRYLLQSNRDPSLLVPLSQAWSESGPAKALLRSAGFDARSFLLLTLGQAARLDPAIGTSLGEMMPDGYETDAEGAVTFLTEKAALLEESGFGVMLPAWWAGRNRALRLTTRAVVRAPKMRSTGELSLDQVVRFDWQVALGGEVLSQAELEALARLKTPLVRLRGRWVLLSAQEIRQALSLLRRKGALSGRDLLRLALDPQPERDDHTPDQVEAEGWFADLLARLTQRDTIEAVSIPSGFHGALRPYQERGYAWLRFLRRWGIGPCLADDMGLGKTVQTLAHLQRDKEEARVARRKRPCVLLVCPTSVVGNWQREAARFTPGLSVWVHYGVERERGTSFRKVAQRHDLVITSYSLLQRDIEALSTVKWTGVVLDEAQNIKNPHTKQAKAARQLMSEYRIALTGTPIENHVGELWSLLEFLNPGFLGSESAFKRRFFLPIQAGHDPIAAERLKALTGPFILRRLKTDPSVIADLPAKLEMTVACTLTREQASLYAAVVEDATAALEDAAGIRRKGLVLATLSKLKQICNHPAQFLGDNSAIPNRSGKLARLGEMLDEVLASGERALVFTQFTEMGDIIKAHLEAEFGREVLFLHGGVPKPQRDRMIERFQACGEGDPSLFLLSLKAGGTGLNLTAANHVFHFDRWWNPAVEDQATDRAFRIGQTRRVQVHKFLCAGTVEEKIDAMIEQKKEIAGQIIGSGEDWLTTLSTAELRDLFALRQEAMSAET